MFDTFDLTAVSTSDYEFRELHGNCTGHKHHHLFVLLKAVRGFRTLSASHSILWIARFGLS